MSLQPAHTTFKLTTNYNSNSGTGQEQIRQVVLNELVIC